MTTVANFAVEYHQFIDEHGAVQQDLPAFATDSAHLLKLYETMVLTRVFDAKAIALQRTGKMGTYASALGQEAFGTAIGDAMQADDVLCPYYRDYAAMLQRGVTMRDIFTYWGGDERGSEFTDNPKSQDFPLCVPIATQSLHATGVAFAMKHRKQKRAVVTTIGEGGTSKGDFYEAMNVAGAWQLPVLFVVNNNQWAISVSRKIQTATDTIAQKAIAAGIACEQVDGNDIVAMRDRVGKALERARNGEGATMIEAISYRLCDHTTADDASRYRRQEELDEAWQREPIARLKQYLIHHDDWSEDKDKALQEQCAKQVEAAVEEYMNMDKPSAEDMFTNLYADVPEPLADQVDEAIYYGGQA